MRRIKNADVREYRGVEPLPLPVDEMISIIGPLATEARRTRIEDVAKSRILSVIPVLEGLSDPRNGAAIMRSCDAFGCHELHLIDGRFPFAISDHVSRKTDRWLEPRHFPSLAASAADLHARGHKIFYATMDGERTPEDFRRDEKVAILFGNEHKGPSAEARALAAGTFRIPMFGFVESLNVGVAAAIALQTICRGRHGELDETAQRAIVARYLWQTVPRAEEAVAAAINAKTVAASASL